MPHYRLDAKRTGLLIGFLGSKTDSISWVLAILIRRHRPRSRTAKGLVNERGCAACHEINGIKRPE